jgi:hypothetical protein
MFDFDEISRRVGTGALQTDEQAEFVTFSGIAYAPT